MIKSLIDAGPMIALFDKSDKYHETVLNFFKDKSLKLFSTWPVITEVTHMLTFNVNAQIDFLTWINKNAVEIVEIKIIELHKIIEMMKKYCDIPMDLADPSLIYLSETLKINTIITIDSEYYIYRTKNKKMLENLIEKLIK